MVTLASAGLNLLLAGLYALLWHRSLSRPEGWVSRVDSCYATSGMLIIHGAYGWRLTSDGDAGIG
jgi:hypothetical protein